MKEKENKGFFSFFQRSKKKREQVSFFLGSILQDSSHLFLIASAFYLEMTNRFCVFVLYQTASAPATPLVSKHRPTFTRSNTISKPYISNTLPSDAPKKRRAPLPPMPGSQSTPQDLAHIQERPASCVVKSLSVDETEKVCDFVLCFEGGAGGYLFFLLFSFST